ncbi:rho family-interacting cell polarization regulator 2 isoform X2 [Rhinatrema bivittatum]|uniref:rho family-interacting cell polarization regulator 2 isoform X2 n=2 Tax=Rhinatrema bivittatum TaxID=194408 RepID=UPI00112E2456|nr:rho family-interacting cell polarization regulator 2 isoform X2 [Rhinatrema bivittatum]
MGCLEEDLTMLEESDDVFCEEISSRIPDIMSVGSQSFSLGGPNGILRSQSFAGFSGLPERRSRCNSFLGNSATPKKPQAKLKKMHNLGYKTNSTPKQPQPERVEEVYGTLKNGLDEYLEVHQKELDKLTTQLKDMRTNSRLGVLYDLDKQIKAIERYIRRLEFHISKVDELYEAYGNRRRLREGAFKMKQAFAMSPSSKAARESLSEINKSYKEYTENMCTVEAEMENLLGEFYIKMKGLAGFARLCPGDQYEIFMRYGRQRWKLKGKIEVNGKQSWDGEEMAFLPLINGLISIKVTELKGLATHILVGSVTCETKDLFSARPQVVAVDINDLGTIKLNLEVSWYPFDSEDLTPSTGNVNKASALQRRASIYSQGTPETPTFKDHSFFSHLPDDVFENGVTANEKRPLSLSFGDLPNGDCTPPSRSTASSDALGLSNPEITITPPDLSLRDIMSNPPSVGSCCASSSAEPMLQVKGLPAQLDHTEQRTASNVCQKPPAPASDNLFLDTNVPVSLLQDPDEVSELKPVELDTSEGNITKQLVKRLTSAETPTTQERLISTEVPRTLEKLYYDGSVSCESEGYRSYLDGSLEEALQGLLLALEPYKDHYKEFQVLDQKLMELEDILKCKPTVNRSRSSSISLTVESALESFDFLNTSDFEDVVHDEDDDGDVCNGGGADSVFSDTETEKSSYRLEHPEARGHLSEALTEDTGVGTSVAGSPLPLTTGNESLDISLVRHLQYCTQLIQQIMCSDKASLVVRGLLDMLVKQILVLEKLAQISAENMGNLSSVTEAIPGFHKKQSLLSFWAKCSGPMSVYHTSTDKMIKQLDASFGETVNEECPGLTETAFRTLVTQILDQTEPALSSSLASEVITVFQYYNFFTSQNISDLRNYLVRLAKEALLFQILQTSRDNKLLQNVTEQAACCLPPRPEVLRALALLLTESDSEDSQAEKLLLSNAAENSYFRKKALIYYCEALTQSDPLLQKAARLALKCLQDTESIQMLVMLCQSDKEDVRKVATETLLSLGEDGRLAYEQLDKAPQEVVKVGTRRGATDATAF